MAGYKGHLVGSWLLYAGLCAGFISLRVAPGNCHAEWLTLISLGALFPDVDTKSKGQKVFYAILIVFLSVIAVHGYHKSALGIAALSLLPLLVAHRGLFHQRLFLLLLIGSSCYLLMLIFPHESRRILYDGFFFLLGAFSHILIDYGPRRFFVLR